MKNWNGRSVIKEDATAAFLEHTTSKELKSEYLGYLRDHGNSDDIPVIKKEFERNDPQTSASSVEAIIAISSRTSAEDGAKAILNYQFEAISATALESGLAAFDTHPNKDLLRALEHRSRLVRRRAVNLLIDRDAFNVQLADRISADPDAELRLTAIDYLENCGQTRTLKQAEEILVRPKQSGPLGLSSDTDGERALAQYKHERTRRRTDEELAIVVRDWGDGRDDAYFEAARRKLDSDSETILADIANEFSKTHAEYIESIRRAFAGTVSDDIIAQHFAPSGERMRKAWMQRATSLICEDNTGRFIDYIRQAVQSTFLDNPAPLFNYIGRHGNTSDIILISQVYEENSRRTPHLYLGLVANTSAQSAGKAIASLAKANFTEVITSKIHSDVLAVAIENLPRSNFKDITDDFIFKCFKSESGAVRRSIALQCVSSLTKNKINGFVKEVMSWSTRYYNVVHWLDLGNSLSRRQAQIVAKNSAHHL